ncbi:MAG: hypothetical protein R3C19_21855 [Planctomycetaceae bacterium]
MSYTLAFTIEDAANQGYHVRVDTSMRGYSTARFSSGSSSGNVVNASGTTVYGSVDTDTTDGNSTLSTFVGDLTLNANQARASSSSVFSNVLTADADSLDLGFFTGTRSFALRYTTSTAPHSATILGNTVGEAALRFGLDPTNDPAGTPFNEAFYVGPDGEPASLHGHFVTVSAEFTAVPEPGTTGWISGIAAAFACCIRRLKRTHRLPPEAQVSM